MAPTWKWSLLLALPMGLLCVNHSEVPQEDIRAIHSEVVGVVKYCIIDTIVVDSLMVPIEEFPESLAYIGATGCVVPWDSMPAGEPDFGPDDLCGRNVRVPDELLDMEYDVGRGTAHYLGVVYQAKMYGDTLLLLSDPQLADSCGCRMGRPWTVLGSWVPMYRHGEFLYQYLYSPAHRTEWLMGPIPSGNGYLSDFLSLRREASLFRHNDSLLAVNVVARSTVENHPETTAVYKMILMGRLDSP